MLCYYLFLFNILFISCYKVSRINKRSVTLNSLPNINIQNENKGLNITAIREYIKSKINNNSSTKIQ